MNRRNIATIIIIIICVIIFFAYFYVKNRGFKLEYEILKNPASFVEARDIKKRGYEIIKKDGEYYLVVCYGEQSSYYSYAVVDKIIVNGSSVVVTIKLPDRDINASVGEAFSYPKAIIKFNK